MSRGIIALILVGLLLSSTAFSISSSEALRIAKPIFSDAERKIMPKKRPLRLTWLRKRDGTCVLRINGRGIWGTSGSYSNEPLCQVYYESRILPQQGWNNLRLGIRPVGYGLDHWVEVVRAFESQGITTTWGAYGMMNSFISRVLGMGEDELGDSDNIIEENDERKRHFGGMGSLGNPWNPEFLRNSSRMWEVITERLRYRSVIGYQITNEINMGNGSYDQYARQDWQRFLKHIYMDLSPGIDSNGDGAVFNKLCGKSYSSWDEVEMFRLNDLKDPACMLLKDVWLGTTYAGYIQKCAEIIHRKQPQALTSASICVPFSAPVDLSYLCTMPDINVAFINTYGCWLGSGLMMAAIANTFGRAAIASEINFPAGDYDDVKWTALTMLPYYDGFQWFGYNLKDGSEPLEEEMVSEYGGKYGLIDRGMTGRYDGDGDPRRAGEVCKVVKYDPRFAIIPQLAPFAGRVDSGIRKDILWILSSGYRPDYEEDHKESNVFRAHVTSDMALALKPDAVSFAGRKVIIYRNSQSPCISKQLYRKLRDYVLEGGTVVTDAYNIAAGGTLLGEDNRNDWWQGLRLARDGFSAEGWTIIRFENQSLEVAGTHQYLLPESPEIGTDGEVRDSLGKSYPLVLVRQEGRGRWVLINYPGIFRMTEKVGGWQAAKYDGRFRIIREIVRKYAGVELPYRYEMQVYAGDSCGLAIKEPTPNGVTSAPDIAPRFKANGRTVAFEIFEKKIYGGPCITPKDGMIEIPCAVKAGEAKLWVLKPYGKPVVLYSDGTEKNQGRMDGGIYQNYTLTLTFAEKAYISSPAKPKGIFAEGKSLSFGYDKANRLLIVRGPGRPVRAIVKY